VSNFLASFAELAGKKVRFYTGGGDRGIVQGPIVKVEGDMVVIEKEGEIRGTLHTITVNAGHVLYYEIDTLKRSKPAS
jgi:hypothetical protein